MTFKIRLFVLGASTGITRTEHSSYDYRGDSCILRLRCLPNDLPRTIRGGENRALRLLEENCSQDERTGVIIRYLTHRYRSICRLTTLFFHKFTRELILSSFYAYNGPNCLNKCRPILGLPLSFLTTVRLRSVHWRRQGWAQGAQAPQWPGKFFCC